MRLTAPLIALLLLAACVDPQLQAGISIGPNGTSVYPAISTGIEGGGTITYSPDTYPPRGPAMRFLAALSLATLAACGADGPPVPPSKAMAQPGISVSGMAKVGIAGN
ncbi:MAG: hypothetical protein IPL38_14385 [Rhodobacter sp.]|nr:hypothetical protein [Rhodobacter sp.]